MIGELGEQALLRAGHGGKRRKKFAVTLRPNQGRASTPADIADLGASFEGHLAGTCSYRRLSPGGRGLG